MPIGRRRSPCLVLACAAALAFTACSSPPKAKGPPKRTVLMTEFDDARVGKEASQDVVAQLGLLSDPQLDAYVQGIGRKLLRGVSTRGFDYQFKVVDQAEPNAFTLPGGYIFMSRGLLALANSEDELACVIGHEITHAAHRHAAAQQAVGSGGNPLTLPWVRAAQLASYGRDMERDADQGGQILCAAAGYDPAAMSTFLTALLQAERLETGGSRSPSFYDSHPGTQERVASTAVRAREIRSKRDESLGNTRAALLQHLDGLPVGQRPETGVFIGDRFVHPDLGFQLRFPPGWAHTNTNQMVGATSPRGDAVVFLAGAPPADSAQAAAEAWLAKEREEQPIETLEAGPVKIGGVDAWRLRVSVSARGGSLSATVVFIPFAGATYVITAFAPSFAASQHAGAFQSTVRSFGPITDEERRSIRSTHLRVVKANQGEDIASLDRRTTNAWDLETTAVYNGIFAIHRFSGGELVKITREEPYVRKPATP